MDKPVEPKVRIGERWVPEHVVRRDTKAGIYEEINSPMYKASEGEIQAALLKPPRPWLE